MNALGATLTLVFATLVVVGSRRTAMLGVLAGILYLTQQQAISIGGFNLYAFRFIEIACLFRLWARGERPANRSPVDSVLIALYLYTVCVYLVRSDEGGYGYQIGTAIDTFICYFTFRTLLTSVEDLRWALGAFAWLLLPYVPLLAYESITFSNPFAAIGGVELIRAGDLWIRGTRLRATGSFGHPSLMGTVGGTFFPIYVGLWLSGDRRKIVGTGALATAIMVWASNSGGPAICMAVAIVGWMLWSARAYMLAVRVATFLAVGGLALVMNAPIWYILARISSITGGDGFHRSALLDVAFQNLGQWWLAGMPVLSTSKWLPYTNTSTGAVDMTNNFLVFGITAGLGAVLLLVLLLVRAFGALGRAMERIRSEDGDAKSTELLLWGIGTSLGAHVFNWFGITYWDQSGVIWFFHLAAAASAAALFTPTPSRTPDAHPSLTGSY